MKNMIYMYEDIIYVVEEFVQENRKLKEVIQNDNKL